MCKILKISQTKFDCNYLNIERLTKRRYISSNELSNYHHNKCVHIITIIPLYDCEGDYSFSDYTADEDFSFGTPTSTC